MSKIIIGTIDFSSLNARPVPGSYIFGIDSADQFMKKMDSDGIITSVVQPKGAAPTPIDYSSLLTLSNSFALEPGFYIISDKADQGIIVQALTTSVISTDALGIFQNPDYQNIGDYSNVEGYTGFQKNNNYLGWTIEYEVITLSYDNVAGSEFKIGDIITDSVTGATGVVTNNVVSFTNNLLSLYVTSPGISFGLNQINNGASIPPPFVITTADILPSIPVALLTEGDIVFYNGLHYQVINSAFFNGTNPSINVEQYQAAYRVLPKLLGFGYITEVDKIGYDIVTDSIFSRRDKRGNILGLNSDYFQWGNDAVSNNVSISGGGFFVKNQRGSLNANIAMNAGSLTCDERQTSQIQGCTFEGGNSEIALNNGGFDRCTINYYDNFIFLNSTLLYFGCVIEGNKSTFQASIDITSLTNIDIAPYNYAGIIHLTSTNPTEGIIEFKNFSLASLFVNLPSNIAVKFYPAVGLIVTFYNYNNMVLYSVDALPIKCTGGIDAVVNGSNGDWIEFTKRDGYIYQTGGATY